MHLQHESNIWRESFSLSGDKTQPIVFSLKRSVERTGAESRLSVGRKRKERADEMMSIIYTGPFVRGIEMSGYVIGDNVSWAIAAYISCGNTMIVSLMGFCLFRWNNYRVPPIMYDDWQAWTGYVRTTRRVSREDYEGAISNRVPATKKKYGKGNKKGRKGMMEIKRNRKILGVMEKHVCGWATPFHRDKETNLCRAAAFAFHQTRGQRVLAPGIKGTCERTDNRRRRI